jgi:hypothetical protein
MEYIKIGGRKLELTEGQKQVARSGEWILHSSTASQCGKYQNYKLYRDVKAAPKKVFYLGYNLQSKRMCYVHDFMVLQEHYAGMAEWVEDAINGGSMKAPAFLPWNDIGIHRERVVGQILPPDVVNRMLSVLKRRWENGRPLSCFPQTRRLGRYAPDYFANGFGIEAADAEETIGSLIANGALSIEICDKTTKRKGLRVLVEVANA